MIQYSTKKKLTAHCDTKSTIITSIRSLTITIINGVYSYLNNFNYTLIAIFNLCHKKISNQSNLKHSIEYLCDQLL